MQSVKKPTIIETVTLNRLHWFGYVQRMEENGIPKRLLYMNLWTTRLRGGPRSRWQDEVREDGRIVDGEGWQEKVHNREEWKKLLRTARNCRILHMPMEWMNEWINYILCLLNECKMRFFLLIHDLKIGVYLRVMHSIKHVLYKYLFENWKLWREDGFILYSGKCTVC
jgi:hypothetical protein